MKKILLFPLLVFCGISFAQKQTINLDLAALDTGTTHTFPIPDASVLEFTLSNVLSNDSATYAFKVEYQFVEPEPLPDLGTRGMHPVNSHADSLDLLNASIVAELGKVQDEKKMPEAIKALPEKLNAMSAKDYILEKCKLLSTRTIPLQVEEKKNNNIHVTITRQLGKQKAVWEIVYAQQPAGKWITTYGFSFVPSLLFPVDEFYSKTDTGGTFIITKKKAHTKLDLAYVPTIFVQYIPERFATNTLVSSLTFGIGANSKIPSAFIGYSGIYHYNAGFSVGLAFGQKRVLKGEYDEGQRIKENLDAEQLTTDRYYFPEVYFSIFFRFGKNPFETSDKKDDSK